MGLTLIFTPATRSVPSRIARSFLAGRFTAVLMRLGCGPGKPAWSCNSFPRSRRFCRVFPGRCFHRRESFRALSPLVFFAVVVLIVGRAYKPQTAFVDFGKFMTVSRSRLVASSG